MAHKQGKFSWLLFLFMLSILMTVFLLVTDYISTFGKPFEGVDGIELSKGDAKSSNPGTVSYNKSALNSVWRWECIEGTCQKYKIDPNNESGALSLPACRLFCSEVAALWPKPTGDVKIGHSLAKINVNSIDIIGYKSETPITNLVRSAGRILKEEIQGRIGKHSTPKGGKSLVINVDIQDNDVARLTLTTDESYDLKSNLSSDGRIQAYIKAHTFFGFRHGLQTLNQLIIFDDLRGEIQMPSDVYVTDAPAYPYRGVLLDTSRNYITISTIKSTLRAMGASKLNTFHWHITDSHSFPYVSPSRPELSKFGAYSPSKIYTPEDIADIIEYATVRGIRVIPELDAPAHVGEGWQNTSLVTCFNWQPWQLYCVEPPCGQFDPTKDKLYDVLEDIYGDMLQQFQPDIFHMGGDEVNFNCWRTTENIVKWMQEQQNWGLEDKDFVKLWDYFQTNALQRLYKRAGKPIPVIMWTSHLTKEEYLLHSLPKDKYIIQIWTLGNDSQVDFLLKNDYRVILSNYDALYLDCGFAGWVKDGNNWCSPYIGWQKVYENTPYKIAGNRTKQVLGEEATLWTEQADSASIDSRLWPRAAAMAEVLWSEPFGGWETAEQRILVQRERLIELGVNADSIEPEWCLQNEENCRLGAKFNKAKIFQ